MKSHLLADYLRLGYLPYNYYYSPENCKSDTHAYLALQKLYHSPRRQNYTGADDRKNIKHRNEQRNYSGIVKADYQQAYCDLGKGHEKDQHIRFKVFAQNDAQGTLCRADDGLRLFRQDAENCIGYSVVIKGEEYRRYNANDRCEHKIRQSRDDGGYPTENRHGKVHDRAAEGRHDIRQRLLDVRAYLGVNSLELIQGIAHELRYPGLNGIAEILRQHCSPICNE